MDTPSASTPVSSHLVIAGTGRAGTSFLVRFLEACGLDTGTDDSVWFDRANAGLEHALSDEGPLPYVVKDPWLSLYCRQVDLGKRHVDALLVPIRDLDEAAASRVLQERTAVAEQGWSAREVDVFGQTPGGVIYSLSVADQARLLAVGFHDLLWWAVEAQIDFRLLAFPRIVNDAEYLVDRLWFVLEGTCTREAALAAHARLADPAAVRVGTPGDDDAAGPPTPGSTIARAPRLSDASLDRRSLVERIRELEVERAAAVRAAAARDAHLAEREQQLADCEAQVAEHAARIVGCEARIADAEAQLVARDAELARRDGALAALTADLAERDELRRREASRAAALTDELEAVHGTRAWRLARRYWAVQRRFRS